MLAALEGASPNCQNPSPYDEARSAASCPQEGNAEVQQFLTQRVGTWPRSAQKTKISYILLTALEPSLEDRLSPWQCMHRCLEQPPSATTCCAGLLLYKPHQSQGWRPSFYTKHSGVSLGLLCWSLLLDGLRLDWQLCRFHQGLVILLCHRRGRQGHERRCLSRPPHVYVGEGRPRPHCNGARPQVAAHTGHLHAEGGVKLLGTAAESPHAYTHCGFRPEITLVGTAACTSCQMGCSAAALSDGWLLRNELPLCWAGF